MATKNITLSLTDKEFEILRRAIVRYSAEQMNKSRSWGNIDSDEDDAYEIRALIALGLESKLYKKARRHPELDYISIF